MAKTTHDTWNPHCLDAPMFAPLQRFAPYVRAHCAWPSLTHYQTLLDTGVERIHTQNKNPLRVTPQSERSVQFCEHYEPRIFLHGELQTRCENWHDFFQILVWRTFPKTKCALNACHYRAAHQRLLNDSKNPNRSPIENAATLLDECGAILISSQPGLLQYVRDHSWNALFWINREQLATHFRCLLLGHALYEKAINPYIGMTAQTLLLDVDESVLALSQEALNAYCDERIAQLFASNAPQISSPKNLAPFPLLGMPGWHPENHRHTFYKNEQYFRPKRSDNDS